MTRIIDIAMNEFSLPKVVSYDNNYYIELKKLFIRYEKHLKKVSNIDKDCLKRVKRNIDLLINCLVLYNNAKIEDAKNCIIEILKEYITEPYVVASVDKNYAFRGSAPEEIQSEKYNYFERYAEMYQKMNQHKLSFFKARIGIDNIKRRDMMHIPFDKRGLISTQRFSIAGVPCLYLSTTTFGCWLEMEMPELEVFQVASYEVPYDLKVLNMCISQHTINGNVGGYCEDYELHHIWSLLEIFPLVCATSFRVIEMNRSFKSEFIISQLLMQAANELGIDGIAYLSKKMEDYYAYPQAVNLAVLMPSEKLPPYSKKSLDMYWKNAKKVELSEAYRYSEFIKDCRKTSSKHEPPFNSYVNEIYYDNDSNQVLLGGGVFKYTETKFSEFDEFLVKQKKDIFK